MALFIDTSKNHRTVGALLTGLSMVVILTAGEPREYALRPVDEPYGR